MQVNVCGEKGHTFFTGGRTIGHNTPKLIMESNCDGLGCFKTKKRIITEEIYVTVPSRLLTQ